MRPYHLKYFFHIGLPVFNLDSLTPCLISDSFLQKIALQFGWSCYFFRKYSSQIFWISMGELFEIIDLVGSRKGWLDERLEFYS